MAWRAHTRTFLLALSVIVSVKLGQQIYRWAAYGEERSQLRVLNGELEVAGLGVMQTQLQADSLRRVIAALDRELGGEWRALAAVERRAEVRPLSRGEYERYRARLLEYNRGVEERNARYELWKRVVQQNHRTVGRYNQLADSIRRVAGRMGEPYYPVPTPAELAVRHGLTPPGS